MEPAKAERILIVEDDDAVARLEHCALERRGYCVTTVATISEALAVIQSTEIDLVVTDYQLPEGTTGLQLFAAMQSLGYDIPVILVTSSNDESIAIQALRQGLRDFIPKTPELLDYLPDAVERVLRDASTARQLVESESRFQLFMDNSPAIAFVKDEEGSLLYANRRFEVECLQTRWQGKTDWELWPQETADRMRENDAAVLAADQPRQFSETLTRSDGRVCHWLTYRFPFQAANGRRLLGGMAVDVTQQRAAEELLQVREDQLRQAQKIEAVGQLAGGMAHDFNNLLTIILGYCDILLQQVEMRDKHVDLLREIHTAGERAALLTRQLLAFSRKQVLAPKVVDLNAIVVDTENMLSRLIGENIQVTSRLSPELVRVIADPGQVEQVIMNLALNARDAMPLGGEIWIETGNITLDETYAAFHADVKPGKYAMLAVSDSGCGMTKAMQARIFEPFFTTKEVGKGTGLGLATVYGIVKQSGGCIWVYSEPGQGATFKVYLPAAPSGQPASKSDLEEPEIPRGDETVLLVEDEPSVRALARRSLEMYGYTVLEANHPLEAIRISQSYVGKIHLMVTDVVMPQLNGRRLADLMQPDRPDMKVLFMSGYTDDAVVRQGLLEADVNFLQKPFTPVLLAAKVHEVLRLPEPSYAESGAL